MHIANKLIYKAMKNIILKIWVLSLLEKLMDDFSIVMTYSEWSKAIYVLEQG